MKNWYARVVLWLARMEINESGRRGVEADSISASGLGIYQGEVPGTPACGNCLQRPLHPERVVAI